MPPSTQYDALIEKWAAQFKIPTALAIAQNHAEDAPEDPGAVSKCGAIGLFQLEPATAGQLLQNPIIIKALLAVPEVSVILGTFYDSHLKAEVTPWFPAAADQWKATMAAYNCGAGRLHQAIEACAKDGKDATVFQEVQAYLPAQTQTYTQAIWAEFAQADNPEG